MTVSDWIASRAADSPPALRRRILAELGDEANVDEARTMEICLGAAARALGAIIDARRFDRAGALDLLVVDALTTYAYEHASADHIDLDRAARSGLRQFGEIAASHG